jgi:hypothetical protein
VVYPVVVLCTLIFDALKLKSFVLLAIPLPLALGVLFSFRIVSYLLNATPSFTNEVLTLLFLVSLVLLYLSRKSFEI